MNWHEWIEAFRQQVPPNLHPAGASWVHEWIGHMHAAADCGDAEAIKHLAAKVQDKIADEEDWDAQKLASVQQCKAGVSDVGNPSVSSSVTVTASPTQSTTVTASPTQATTVSVNA